MKLAKLYKLERPEIYAQGASLILKGNSRLNLLDELTWFYRYVNEEQKTKEGYTADGYWKSGDLGILLENGALK